MANEETIKPEEQNEEACENNGENISETEENPKETEAAEANDANASGEKKSFFQKKQKQNAEKKQNSELDEAKQKISELNDKYLRLAADFDNFKKRTSKENETRYLDARADTVKLFIPIIDSFERALAVECPDDAKAMYEGMKMIYDMYLKILKDLGVEEIEALGKQFSPELHHAVMHTDDENYGENTICEVFEKGYKMGDRILRYSLVKVAN